MPAGEQTTGGTKSAQEERERRSVERGLFQELSRYYPLEPDQEQWESPPLLLKGKFNMMTQRADDIPLTRIPLSAERSRGSPGSPESI